MTTLRLWLVIFAGILLCSCEEASKPAATEKRPTFNQQMSQFIVLAASLKIVGCMVYALYTLTTSSKAEEHTVGKMLMAALGGLCAFWMANSLNLFADSSRETVRSFILAPAPQTFIGHVGWTLAAGIPGFLIVFYFSCVLDASSGNPWSAGLHIFVLTILTGFAIPILFWPKTLDVASYRGFDLAIGWMIGSILYFAIDLMATPHDQSRESA